MRGSGTLANEVMLQQIRMLKERGLILSNGEFGSRLIQQAERNQLSFDTYEVEWGLTFDVSEIKRRLEKGTIKWLLFCHCETSTGMLNDLNALASVCGSNNCYCFVDCMSSIGTHPLDLSHVTMATGSSGKGLASFPGLALVFSNIDPMTDHSIPMYLDLDYYAEKNHIPFTISSNLVRALKESITEKNSASQLQLIEEYSGLFFEIFDGYQLVPFSRSASKVFTLSFPGETSEAFIMEMASNKILLSFESNYLRQRSWMQVAVFGCYEEAELDHAKKSFSRSLERLFESFSSRVNDIQRV